MKVKRGDIVAYWREPHIPLKVISDPFPFQGGGQNRDDAARRKEKS